jgi:uncharacterized protein YndB with AHSA1/START domain
MVEMATLEMDRQKGSVGESGALMLEMTRVIRASRARVYEAWTRPEVLKEWFGSKANVVSTATFDVRDGGEYKVECFGKPCNPKPGEVDESRVLVLRGEYRKVIPNELLQFTWCGDRDPSEVSLVTVSLRDVEGGTEITLRHEQFATESSRDDHQHGWSDLLPNLAKLLEG